MADNEDDNAPIGQWPASPLLVGTHRIPQNHRGRPGGPGRRDRPPRRPLLGLAALILLGLLAAFFAWVSAEPLWLSMGHATRGTATVIHCSGHGLDQRCQARFAATDATFTAERVDLVGARVRPLSDGARVNARMVSPSGRLAYAGDRAGLALRWGLGLALMLLCGVAIGLSTGAHRLPAGRPRWYALLASMAGPLLLMAGMLVMTR